jgi:hypothetical protein
VTAVATGHGRASAPCATYTTRASAPPASALRAGACPHEFSLLAPEPRGAKEGSNEAAIDERPDGSQHSKGAHIAR